MVLGKQLLGSRTWHAHGETAIRISISMTWSPFAAASPYVTERDFPR